MGDPPTIKNLVITILYLAIWVFVILVAMQYRNRTAMKYYLAFWLLTLCFAIAVILVNMGIFEAFWIATDLWLTIFVALFITPWYGVNLFAEGYFVYPMIISSISLILVITTAFSLKRLHSIQNENVL